MSVQIKSNAEKNLTGSEARSSMENHIIHQVKL